MKQRLLSFVAIAALSCVAMAQTWTAPVEPVSPANILLENAATVESGNAYYIMNIGAGQFITGANDWATEISLSSDATPYVQILVEEIAQGSTVAGTKGTANTAMGDGFTFKLNGQFLFNGSHGSTVRTNHAVSNSYLFRDAANGYVDMNNQNKGFVWKLTESDNGYYIQTIEEDTNFPNAAEEYAGSTGVGNPVKFNCTIEDADIEWIFIPVTAFDVDEYKEKAASFAGDLAIYKSRKALYDVLVDAYTLKADYSAASAVYENNESTTAELDKATADLKPLVDARRPFPALFADATSYGADATAAQAVYNNGASTAEQLAQAEAAFREVIRAALLSYASKNSTPAAPIELTNYLMVNPDFNNGNIDGWTVTGRGSDGKIGQNQGYQANQVYKNETDKENVIVLEKFIEAWRPAPTYLSDGEIYQTIQGLPDGHYILECDGIARHQTAEGQSGYVDPDEYRGIYLFYSDGKMTVHSESTLRDILSEDGEGNPIRLPDHFTFEFDIEGVESINIGLMADNSNLNWMAADNFKLFMAGPSQTPPIYTALKVEVLACANFYSVNEYSNSNADLKEAFENAIDAASELTEAAADLKKIAAYQTAYDNLIKTRDDFKGSLDAYAKLPDFLTKLKADQERFSAEIYADLKGIPNGIIADFFDTDGQTPKTDLATETINSTIEGYDASIKNGIQALFDKVAKDAAEKGTSLEEPINITSLFDYMSYAYGTTQTEYVSGYPAPNAETGVQPVWMVEEGGYFKINYSTGEVWNAHPFRIARTLEGLPNGRYEIRVHGAYRMAAHDVNYPAYNNGEYADNDGAFLFAGSNKTPFINMAEITTSAPIVEGNDANVGTEEAPIYVINGQQAAHMLFSDAAYADLAKKCYLAVATNVKNGTLTMGVMGNDQLQANHWTVWQDFELYYYGAPNASALDDEIQALIDIADPIFQEQGEGDNLILVQSILDDLSKAVKDGQDALASEVEKDKQAAIKTLEDAIAAARENMSVFAELMSLSDSRYNAMNELAEYTFEDTTYPELVNEVIQRLNNEYFDSELQENVSFDSHDQMVTYLNRMKDEWYPFLLSVQGMDQATEDDPIDLTYLITNATFDDMTGATKADPQGWTCEYENKDGAGREGVAEFWNASAFNIYQEIPQLKDGYWRLSVDAVYRAGNAGEEAKDDNGNYKNDEYLYVNDLTTKIIQWSDTKRGAIIPENPETYTPIQQLYTQDGVQFDAPNNQANFLQFIEKGRYHNVLIFGYGEGIEGAFTGSITIGLKKTVAVANDWCPFDNFKLEYLGTEQPTAVESLGTKAATGAAISSIFSIDGRQQSQLRRGINIVRTADGKVTKVLVK